MKHEHDAYEYVGITAFRTIMITSIKRHRHTKIRAKNNKTKIFVGHGNTDAASTTKVDLFHFRRQPQKPIPIVKYLVGKLISMYAATANTKSEFTIIILNVYCVRVHVYLLL